jgi:3-deoxy-D-manno-octulosonate 8-phosphate phosphatase KdsC-like HAD superfamily phosphatase
MYDWKINNLTMETRAHKLKGEGELLGMVYIWQTKTKISTNKLCKIIKERCNDIEIWNIFSNISNKISLVFYCEMKQIWVKRVVLMIAQERRQQEQHN